MAFEHLKCVTKKLAFKFHLVLITLNFQGYMPGALVRSSTLGKCHEEGGSALREGEIEPQETPCS